MKLFTKGREYNNLAKAFNGMFVMINELEVKVTNRNNNEEFNEELLISAYLCRKNILDILEEYNWPIFSPIIIPMMSKGTVTLDFAHQQTVIRLIRISQILNRCDEVNDILEKGDAYYEVEKMVNNLTKNH